MGVTKTTKIVDARGLACPQPVVLTKKALEEVDQLTTIVDNATAKENVSRLAKKEGCDVEIEEKAEDIFLHLTKTGSKEADLAAVPMAGPTVVVVGGDCMGRGSEELGDILVRSFMHTLNEVEPRPDKLIFFNSGVKLTVEGSEVLEDLKALEEDGAEILVCGTCLDYFQLKDKVAVGQVSNMYTIAETLLGTGRTVTI
jgi:selenium metabolism protein YedF